MPNGVHVPADLGYPSLGELKDEVESYLHNIDNPDDIVKYINRTVQELVNDHNFYFMQGEHTITCTDTDRIYNLPIDFLREVDIRLKDPERKIWWISRRNLDRFKQNRTLVSTQYVYCIYGTNEEGVRQIEFYPVTAGSAYLTYLRKMSWVTDTEQRLVVPGNYTEVVVFGALWRAQKALGVDYKDTKDEFKLAKTAMIRAESFYIDADFRREGRSTKPSTPGVVRLSPDHYPSYRI